MDKKEIASGLLKIANTLDNMGLMEEANIVDRVAKKIVVSENPEIKRLQKGEAQSLVPSGDYPTDIQNYKRLYYSGYYDARDEYNKSGFSYYLNLAKNFYLRAMQLYKDSPKQKAFQYQADRIRTDIKQNYTDINDNLYAEKDKPLNYYLKKYDLVDDFGNRKESINNINTFNARWNNLLKDPAISKNGDINYLREQLNNTKYLLKESIPKQQGQ